MEKPHFLVAELNLFSIVGRRQQKKIKKRKNVSKGIDGGKRKKNEWNFENPQEKNRFDGMAEEFFWLVSKTFRDMI